MIHSCETTDNVNLINVLRERTLICKKAKRKNTIKDKISYKSIILSLQLKEKSFKNR